MKGSILIDGGIGWPTGNILYSVRYDDGDFEEDVRRLRIRRPDEVAQKPLSLTGEAVDAVAPPGTPSAGEVYPASVKTVLDVPGQYLIKFE